jgi:hypothetical protein
VRNEVPIDTWVRRTLSAADRFPGRSREEGPVGLFSRRDKGTGSGGSRPSRRADLEHLEQFARSRYGVEGYVEPRTTVTDHTLILIAHDGEWTRRRVPDPRAAREFGLRLGIPVYNVQLTGYPQRMRDYNERRKIEQRRADAAETS